MNTLQTDLLLVMGLLLPFSVSATNGMNLEAYGTEAQGMAGASMAYGNNSAAAMNNPATIGMLSDGRQVELSLGFLGPHVSATDGSETATSKADSYYMPAFGWLSRNGRLAYGVAAYAQGGMAAEYDSQSWLAAGTGLVNRSEITVGRFMLPVSFELNDHWILGGTVDFVWAGMDLQLLMPGSQFLDMMPTSLNPGAGQVAGNLTGSLLENMAALMNLNSIRTINHAYIDFSDNSEFSGAASGAGFAAKVGTVYHVSPDLTLGATYHSPSMLKDLRTDDVTVTMNVDIDSGILAGGSQSGEFTTTDIPVHGVMTVNDFQWPAMFGFGGAYGGVDRWIIALDVKRIYWSQSMDRLTLEFAADDSAMMRQFDNTNFQMRLWQRWHDQTIAALGGSYHLTSVLQLRLGYSYASNPVPRAYINPLFPAVTRHHYTVGVGFDVMPSATVNFSVSYAAPATARNNRAMAGVSSSMRQRNWQLGYVFRY